MEMHWAHFEVLDLLVPSGVHIYHDEGYVNSIAETTRQINEMHGRENRPVDEEDDERFIGRYSRRGVHHHIYYVMREQVAADIQNRAHEETHALEGIGRLDELTQRLQEEQRVMIDLNDIGDCEVRAQMGSLYALYARGIEPWSLRSSYCHETMEEAKRIYRDAKVPPRRYFYL